MKRTKRKQDKEKGKRSAERMRIGEKGSGKTRRSITRSEGIVRRKL